MTRRQWIALVVLGAIAAGLLLAVVLVPWGDDAPSTVAGVVAPGGTYTVRKGDEFVVVLAANPSTGYAWTAAHDPHVTLVGSRQVDHAARPGAAGTQRLTFRAVAAGHSTLRLAYARSFEGGVPPAKRATVEVDVER